MKLIMAVQPPRNICNECGHSISFMDSKSVCPGCQKVLCMHCNLGGLCRDHYNILTPDDQKRIIELEFAIKKYQRLISWNRYLPLLIILPELVFLFAQGWFLEDYWYYGFPIIFCLFFPILGGSRGARQKLQAVKIEKENLLMKYGFQPTDIQANSPHSPFHTRMINSPSSSTFTGPTTSQSQIKNKFTTDSVEKSVCSNCGVKNPSNACFCVGCGKRI